MKILVAVKRVLDPCVAVRLKADGSGVDLANVRMCMNPFDEIALEAAVRLKESAWATEVVAVSCGDSSCQETLRAALAVGADSAILVESKPDLSPLGVAKLLKIVCEREQVGLVICGKQAVDDDANQVGQMLSGLLGWSQAAFASRLIAGDGTLCVERDIDGGRETLQVVLPAVVTTELGLNEPRFATLPNIMKARKKPLQVLSFGVSGECASTQVSVIDTVEPAKRAGGVRLDSVAELAERLCVEAHVIQGVR